MDKICEYNDFYVIPFKKFWNENGNFVLESIRGNGCWGRPSGKYKGNLNKIKTINKSIIFMGHLTSHYGHFLWETLSRFWIFVKLNRSFLDDKEFIFLDFHTPCSMHNYPILNYIMKILNINKYSFRKVTSIQKYKKIYLPETMNSDIFKLYSEEKPIFDSINAIYQKELFYSISKKLVPKFENIKIYITRKRKSDRPTNIYDKLFKKLGFIILYPSTETFEGDLKYYKTARIIAGIDGTGLHNVGFMENPKRYMIELKHRKDIYLEKNKGLSNGQFFFNWFNNVPYTVIPCFKLSFGQIEKQVKELLLKIEYG